MRKVWSVMAIAAVGAACNLQLTNGRPDGGSADPGDPVQDGGATMDADAANEAGSECKSDPANFDIPGNGCDDDGDGKIDNAPTCDDGLEVGGDAGAFAKAMGLCQTASASRWGIVSATYTRGHESTSAPPEGQHGVLPKFGDVIRPREGKRLAVLSTGYAREFNALDDEQRAFRQSHSFSTDGALPPGFPRAAAGCPGSSVVRDVVAVKLEVKAPANAKGFSFDFNFWSSEWPYYVCSTYNDGFIAYLTAKGYRGGTPGNVSFDPKGNPVSVNNNFFDRCTQDITCSGKPPSQCSGGPAELAGTGFGLPSTSCGTHTAGGATGWLQTKAPVQPGETITLELMIWDTGDSSLDSSVLLDHFRWEVGDADGGSVDPETSRPSR